MGLAPAACAGDRIGGGGRTIAGAVVVVVVMVSCAIGGAAPAPVLANGE
jgi:hypothetical protein